MQYRYGYGMIAAAIVAVIVAACLPASSPTATRTEDRVLVTSCAELVGLEKNICLALTSTAKDGGSADASTAQQIAQSCVNLLSPAANAITYAANELDLAAADEHSAALCAAFRTASATTGMLNIAKLYGVGVPPAVVDIADFVSTALNVADQVPCLAFDGGL